MPKELNLPLKAQHKSKKQLLCVQVVIPNVTWADRGTFGNPPEVACAMRSNDPFRALAWSAGTAGSAESFA